MTDTPDPRLRPPGAVLDIARTLQNAGFEAWCVGGAIRDALLGLPHLDWDLATSATPPQVRRLFKRTIPVGIEFGTIGVLDEQGRLHEVTTFRHDVQTDGRHAVVQFGASLDEDLARRDFTINAIAYDPIADRLRDPFGGRADLTAGIIRAVGEAEARMREDRLRALRAIRFSARFAFHIEEETWQAIIASAPFLSRLSPERVKQELDKTMEQVARPSEAFRRWRDAGIFASLVPALGHITDDVLEAVDALPLPVLASRPLRKTLRLAALFSGLDGKEADTALRALRCSNQEVAIVSSLAERWHRSGPSLTASLSSGTLLPDRQLRRLAAETGRLRVGAFLRLAAARWAAVGTVDPSLVRRLYRRVLTIAFRDPISVGDLAIDGEDLRRAGVPAGPAMGRMLQELLDEVLVDPASNRREPLLALVAARLSGSGDHDRP